MAYEAIEEVRSLNKVLLKLEDFYQKMDDDKVSSDNWADLDALLSSCLDELISIREMDEDLYNDVKGLHTSINVTLSLENGKDKFIEFESMINYVLPVVEDAFKPLLVDDKEKRHHLDQLSIPLMSLVNHQIHPTREGYMVFHFKNSLHAQTFQDLLTERSLFYERFDEDRGSEQIQWFGVREQDFDEIEVLNYKVKGLHRKPMIKDKMIRYIIVGLGLLIILIAIIGGIMSNL